MNIGILAHRVNRNYAIVLKVELIIVVGAAGGRALDFHANVFTKRRRVVTASLNPRRGGMPCRGRVFDGAQARSARGGCHHYLLDQGLLTQTRKSRLDWDLP